MFRTDEFRKKEVINIHTAERLGYVGDIDVDLSCGKVISIIIPGGIFRRFFRRSEYVIPWNSIVKVGRDVVLVDYTNAPKAKEKC